MESVLFRKIRQGTTVIAVLSFFLVLILTEQVAYAGKTKAGYFACVSEKSFDEAVKYSVKKDKQAFQQMFQSGECVMLEEGVKVDIENVKGGTVVIRPVGTRLKLWTFIEAIE